MTPSEFEHHFRGVVRVMFDWSEFSKSAWPIELCYFSLHEHADRIYTPWYARADGSVCEYNSPGARPQSIAAVAKNSALLAHHGVRKTPHPESVSVVPAYRLNHDSILLLDGNHRAVSSQVAVSKAGIAACIVNGPIDGQVLADLAHWVE